MKRARSSPSRQRGIGVIELMVALLLGLLVVGGILSIYLSNRSAYRTHQNLARVQENARFAFEFLMRDIREAGAVPCGSRITANVLRNANTADMAWWADTDAGMIRGDDTNVSGAAAISGAAAKVPNTGALLLLRPAGTDDRQLRVTAHDPGAATFTLASTGGVESGDLVLVCDSFSAALLQVGTVTGATNTVSYAGTAHNCTTRLGSVLARCGTPSDKTFTTGSVMSRWGPAYSDLGRNGRGTTSLYRIALAKSSAGASPTIGTGASEMIPGVSGLRIEYLVRNASGAIVGSWETADKFTTGWNSTARQVVAVRVRLTLVSEDAVGSNGQPLTRTLVAVAALRNVAP